MSLGMALFTTIVSLIVGKLVAPGVGFTMEGGLIGVQLSPQIQKYLLQVFLSYFICSYFACFLSDRWIRKNRSAR